MDTLAVILISVLILWVVFNAMNIADDISAVKYEQHEIYLLLEHYLLKREVEREKGKEKKKMTELKCMRERIYSMQEEYEENENYNEQSIVISQRIRALLNIYEQILMEGRVFEEDYLADYLGRKIE